MSMGARGLFFTVCCAGLVTYGLQAAPKATGPSRFLVRIVIDEPGDDRVSTVLADLQFEAVPGMPLKVLSGGETHRYGLQFGTQITGQIDTTDDARIRVALEIDLAQTVHSPSPSTEVVRHEMVSLCTVLGRGTACRVNCGGDRWCKLSLTEDSVPVPSRSR